MSAPLPFMDGRKPLSIIIVGGSIAGLMTGILLHRQGHNVRILEAASTSDREGEAAGIGLTLHVKKFFDEHDRLAHIPLGVPNKAIRAVDGHMRVLKSIPIDFRMTTWAAAYHRLRANFDGYRSAFCAEPPAPRPGDGEAAYDVGTRVLHVEERPDELVVHAERTSHDKSGAKKKTQTQYRADAVIAADGANSSIRRALGVRVVYDESGLIIWRGTIPTKKLSPALVEQLLEKTVQCRLDGHYTLCYAIPGPIGSLALADREINFVWYNWKTAPERAAILTDKTGHQHRKTVGKGQLRDDVWAEVKERAAEMLPSEMRELIDAIEEPFASAVGSVAARGARGANDRIFLVGDALVQVRPNLGHGTSCAALGAQSLAKVFAGELSPAEWERQLLMELERERVEAVEYSSQLLCGWWGRNTSWLWYQWILMSQRGWRWWYGKSEI